MEHLVTRAGHRATAVESAHAALLALKQTQFDVVMVDMEMPSHNGPATISFLKAKFPQLPILVVSGYDDPKHVMAALEAGADGYLVKDDLNETLASCLQNVRAGQAPLSPRVASIVVRKLRKTLRDTAPEGQPALREAPPVREATTPKLTIARLRRDTPA